MSLESDFQSDLIKEIKDLFPGCVVLKNDPNYMQGIPDLLILFRKNWAALEVKRSASEPYRPNQEYYLDMLNKMAYSATIFPENRESILDELQFALRSGRTTRSTKRE